MLEEKVQRIERQMTPCPSVSHRFWLLHDIQVAHKREGAR